MNRSTKTGQVLSENRKFTISIGGIECAVISQESNFLNVLRARYGQFESSRPAAYEILVKTVPRENASRGKYPPLPYPVVKRVNSGSNYILKQENRYAAVVNLFSGKVLVQLEKSPDCFDSFLTTLYLLMLANTRGLVIRASAVRENGQGQVYFDPAGDDRNVLSPLIDGLEVISRETVIVRPHNGGYRIYGTPWGNDAIFHRRNARAVLGGLYCLKNDDRCGLTAMDKVEALANLYQCIPYFFSDHQLWEKIFEACRDLIDAVAVHELHLMPDDSRQQIPV